MKKNILASSHLIALIAIISVLWSCSKEKVAAPAIQQSTLSTDDAMQAGEIAVLQLVPGTYTVLKFIDTGDDETSQFNGYSFKFQANGVLAATTNNGKVFRGTWRLNQAQTRMTISITGTKALDDLDDDNWRVVRITNQRINLKKPGPDQVIFVMQ
jgi:hypothetical protein